MGEKNIPECQIWQKILIWPYFGGPRALNRDRFYCCSSLARRAISGRGMGEERPGGPRLGVRCAARLFALAVRDVKD